MKVWTASGRPPPRPTSRGSPFLPAPTPALPGPDLSAEETWVALSVRSPLHPIQSTSNSVNLPPGLCVPSSPSLRLGGPLPPFPQGALLRAAATGTRISDGSTSSVTAAGDSPLSSLQVQLLNLESKASAPPASYLHVPVWDGCCSGRSRELWLSTSSPSGLLTSAAPSPHSALCPSLPPPFAIPSRPLLPPRTPQSLCPQGAHLRAPRVPMTPSPPNPLLRTGQLSAPPLPGPRDLRGQAGPSPSLLPQGLAARSC